MSPSLDLNITFTVVWFKEYFYEIIYQQSQFLINNEQLMKKKLQF